MPISLACNFLTKFIYYTCFLRQHYRSDYYLEPISLIGPAVASKSLCLAKLGKDLDEQLINIINQPWFISEYPHSLAEVLDRFSN